MNAIIITIGDEILLGQIINTNSQYIARQLTLVGIEVIDILTIADCREEILKWVDFAMTHAELVIVTGGLGPTKDDMTKGALAEYFNTRLTFNEEVLHRIEELLQKKGLHMNENNRNQAYIPENSEVLFNSKGTASGMVFRKEEKTLISLPGVPFEMEEMMEQQVIPGLRRNYPNLLLEYRMVKVYNIPEADLAERLSPWEERLPKGLSLAYLPSLGYMKLRLTGRGEGVAHLNIYFESLQHALEGLRMTVGEISSIERELGELLMIKGKTLSVAESCTGGNIAHRITLVPGSSAYFKGGVVSYGNNIKTQVLGVDPEAIARHGAVSETVVRQMAEGARRLLGTDLAVATSGIAGPEGGTAEKPVGTTWFAIASATGTYAEQHHFTYTRERNINRATMKALQLLIDHLLE